MLNHAHAHSNSSAANMLERTLVPPPYQQPVPHPPAAHNVNTVNEMVLEGKVRLLTKGVVACRFALAFVTLAGSHMSLSSARLSRIDVGRTDAILMQCYRWGFCSDWNSLDCTVGTYCV